MKIVHEVEQLASKFTVRNRRLRCCFECIIEERKQVCRDRTLQQLCSWMTVKERRQLVEFEQCEPINDSIRAALDGTGSSRESQGLQAAFVKADSKRIVKTGVWRSCQLVHEGKLRRQRRGDVSPTSSWIRLRKKVLHIVSSVDVQTSPATAMRQPIVIKILTPESRSWLCSRHRHIGLLQEQVDVTERRAVRLSFAELEPSSATKLSQGPAQKACHHSSNPQTPAHPQSNGRNNEL